MTRPLYAQRDKDRVRTMTTKTSPILMRDTVVNSVQEIDFEYFIFLSRSDSVE